MKPPRLVLASGSPRRREILLRLGIPFDVVVADSALEDSFLKAFSSAEEGPADRRREGCTHPSKAVRMATALAEMKAQSVFRDPFGNLRSRSPEVLVLGADTVVAVGVGASERVLGKPTDPEDAARMLRILSGRDHFVVTAVAVVRSGAPPRVRWEKSRVRFRELSNETIQEYVSTGEPMDKAGAYAIQGRGEALVAGISGCFENIVGLPLVLVARMLEGVAALPSCDCSRHPLQEGEPGCK
jgi:septum formation protein